MSELTEGRGDAARRRVRNVLEDAERIHLETAEQWSAWLERHHTRPEGVWLVQWRARSGRPAIPYEEAITEPLRVARMEAEGRMAEVGLAVLEAAKADDSWTILEPVEDLLVPDDLGAALDSRPGARERWGALPPAARRGFLLWIVTAKRQETRTLRVTESADLTLQVKRLEER